MLSGVAAGASGLDQAWCWRLRGGGEMRQSQDLGVLSVFGLGRCTWQNTQRLVAALLWKTQLLHPRSLQEAHVEWLLVMVV